MTKENIHRDLCMSIEQYMLECTYQICEFYEQVISGHAFRKSKYTCIGKRERRLDKTYEADCVYTVHVYL